VNTSISPGPEPVIAAPVRISPALLRILQIGAIAVVLAASTYKAFELDRYFVPKELTLHLTATIAGLLALRAFRRAAFTWVDLLLVLYILVGAISALTATNVWLAARALAISASGLAVFWAARAVREQGYADSLLAALAIAVVVASATSLLQTYGVRTEMFSINRAPGGTLGNRNFVAHVAAFGLPVVLYVTLRAGSWARFAAGVAGATIVAASLVLTRSRAGWLAFGAAMLVLAVALFLSPPLRRDKRTWTRLAVMFAGAAAGVAVALLTPNTLRWRSDNPYLESIQDMTNYQEGSGRGRLVQYTRSLRMLAADPVLGVGPGNWPVTYPAHARGNDPSMDPNEDGRTSNPWPSSDWVGFASERGIVATLLLAAALLMLALRALRQLLRAGSEDEGLGAATLLATLIAANVAGLFDAVLLLALPTLIVWATLGALTPAANAGVDAVSPRARSLVLIAVLIVSAAGALRSAAQLIGMGMYAARDDSAWLSRAALIDPANYRIHMTLARSGSGLNSNQRCRHAHAANSLFPNAAAARSLSRRCK
jgi:O-antigen ligase